MNHDNIHMIIGDDIYYKKHDFELLSYIRNKPMELDKYNYCY